jgi:hypothetical protein
VEIIHSHQMLHKMKNLSQICINKISSLLIEHAIKANSPLTHLPEERITKISFDCTSRDRLWNSCLAHEGLKTKAPGQNIKHILDIIQITIVYIDCLQSIFSQYAVDDQRKYVYFLVT